LLPLFKRVFYRTLFRDFDELVGEIEKQFLDQQRKDSKEDVTQSLEKQLKEKRRKIELLLGHLSKEDIAFIKEHLSKLRQEI
jgi:polysaccharide deacetylase 2 family uncharacterized protein YibQ